LEREEGFFLGRAKMVRRRLMDREEGQMRYCGYKEVEGQGKDEPAKYPRPEKK